MPNISTDQPYRMAQLANGPLRAPRPDIRPPNPNHAPPAWMFLVAIITLAACATAIALWVRRGPYRAWKAFAAAIGGEFRSAGGLAPQLVTGEVRSRPFMLETATSHEDDAGYYHTRGRTPIKNRASLILGIRRKSLLEEVQTRGEPSPYELDDPDFARHFNIYCNDSVNLPAVLTPEARRELRRYHDVEIYVRMAEMEWRRGGEERDLRTIERLTGLLIDMADAIDALPVRGRSLTQVLADEKVIEKGV